MQLDEALDTRTQKGKGKAKARMPRTARNERFGFGGKKRYSKSNTADSTDDFARGPAKRSSRKPQRPGKSRRAKGRK